MRSRSRREKLPLYEATKSLNVKYEFNGSKHESASITLDGLPNHSLLKVGCDGLLEQRHLLSYKSSLEAVNFATAMITFLYTDTCPDEGYLGEHIEASSIFFNPFRGKDRIISVLDVCPKEENYFEKDVNGKWLTKGKRNEDFNTHLLKRIRAFSSISGDFDLPEQKKFKQDEREVLSCIHEEMFHETFHHTEQTMMYVLSNPIGIHYLVSEVLQLKAAYLYGVVLDTYTQRTMCNNCNAGLLGVQNSHQEGFLLDFKQGLDKERIIARPRLMLNTRVSASQEVDPLRLVNDKDVVHAYDPDRKVKIFQAENKALGTEAHIIRENYSFSSYEGIFFVSSQQLHKVKWEKSIKLSPNQPSNRDASVGRTTRREDLSSVRPSNRDASVERIAQRESPSPAKNRSIRERTRNSSEECSRNLSIVNTTRHGLFSNRGLAEEKEGSDSKKALDHFTGAELGSKDLRLFDNWYSTEAIQSIIFTENAMMPAYRTVLISVDTATEGGMPFEKQFAGLRSLQEKIFPLPCAMFIGFEPAEIHTSHFVFALLVKKTLLLVDPTGKPPNKGLCKQLQKLQEKYGFDILLSNIKIQNDPKGLVSCGPISTELMFHIQKFSIDKIQSTLQGKDFSKQSKRLEDRTELIYSLVDIHQLDLLPSSLIAVMQATDPEVYQKEMVNIRKSHLALLSTIGEACESNQDERSLWLHYCQDILDVSLTPTIQSQFNADERYKRLKIKFSNPENRHISKQNLSADTTSTVQDRSIVGTPLRREHSSLEHSVNEEKSNNLQDARSSSKEERNNRSLSRSGYQVSSSPAAMFHHPREITRRDNQKSKGRDFKQ